MNSKNYILIRMSSNYGNVCNNRIVTTPINVKIRISRLCGYSNFINFVYYNYLNVCGRAAMFPPPQSLAY